MLPIIFKVQQEFVLHSNSNLHGGYMKRNSFEIDGRCNSRGPERIQKPPPPTFFFLMTEFLLKIVKKEKCCPLNLFFFNYYFTNRWKRPFCLKKKQKKLEKNLN